MNFIRQLLNTLVYSNLFIAACAVLMTRQTAMLWLPAYPDHQLLSFVFSSTLTAYCFHYYFTSPSPQHAQRNAWNKKGRILLVILFVLGLAGTIYWFIPLINHWPLLVPAAIATFLYTAPQLPQPIFIRLRKYAYGKTIFLALIWTYVTAVLPLLLADELWTPDFTLYISSRYFFIYCICILFDERDREQDRMNGVKSLITYLSGKGIRLLFILSWLAHIILTLFLLTGGLTITNILILLAPALLLLLVYPRAQQRPTDLFYYVVLDGLLALSALLLLVARI